MNNAIENKFSQRLIRHHLPLAVASLTAIWMLDWFVGFWLNTTEPKFFYFRLSLATGYVALILLIATLSIGAINILRKERNPISSNWRRDVGIWCALVSVVHFIVGWNVHQKHRWQYFFTEDWSFRSDLFGFANYTGLLATIIVVVLLAISNDFSLRRLKAKRWKFLQRFNNALAILVIAHTVLYQILEKRPASLIIPVAVVILFGVVVQILGFKNYRKI